MTRAWKSGVLLAIFVVATLLCMALEARADERPNSRSSPGQVLPTGTDLDSDRLSDNAMQLARQIKLLPLLERLDVLREQLTKTPDGTLDSLRVRLDISETRTEVSDLIQQTQLEVMFVLANILEEERIYSELLASYQSARDKRIARLNTLSFATNGALWVIAEVLGIPSWSRPKYAISSGTVGILAGIIPSVASAYALREVSGKRYSEISSPNMLSKLFDRPTSLSVKYPSSIWSYLDSSPAAEKGAPKRRAQITDRWIADKNIPAFTDGCSPYQIDNVTGAGSEKSFLTIGLLSSRLDMLRAVSAEVCKVDRLLLELMMVARGSKHL